LEEITFVIGGEQGEGIESVGEVVTKVLSRLGYHLYGFRNFSSRIKGGHSDFNLRIHTKNKIYVSSEQVNLLVAFNRDTLTLYKDQLAPNCIILYDPKSVKDLPIDGLREDIAVISAPFQAIAEEVGSGIMKNMVAVGCICALLSIPPEHFAKIIEEKFAKKDQRSAERNITAFQHGLQWIEQNQLTAIPLQSANNQQRLFLSGNDAVAIGAVAAGCRFMAGYPITPASEILENLIQLMPDFGGVAVQAEDELSSVAMAIGASFAGARAMTATAGPGLSLMQEAIGLSGAVEIPLVIVDTQRSGPSSGLATKQEQSDLTALLSGTHGEIPRIVISPSTVEEAMYDMHTAFHLAEKYQCPVLVAGDLVISTSKQTCEPFDAQRFFMDRGKRPSNEELAEAQTIVHQRYEFTSDLISPRTVPGQPYGTHHVTGIEHGPTGHPTENPLNRKQMMIKRMEKIRQATIGEDVKVEGDGEEVLFIGFGSTYGAIKEAAEELRKQGHKVGLSHIRMLHPFPSEQMKQLIQRTTHAIVIENNYTGQLANLIKQHVPNHDRIHSLTKYDGNPFLASHITEFYKELLNHANA
jgi:2-oxoglutarate ferredoxin oxidoreductase subunit alpha